MPLVHACSEATFGKGSQEVSSSFLSCMPWSPEVREMLPCSSKSPK